MSGGNVRLGVVSSGFSIHMRLAAACDRYCGQDNILHRAECSMVKVLFFRLRGRIRPA